MMDTYTIIKRFEEYVHYFNPCCASDAEDHEMLKAVLELLKEQPQQKTGRWNPYRQDSFGWCEVFTCSHCKQNTKHPYPTKRPDEYLYCPYCGAKMENATE